MTMRQKLHAQMGVLEPSDPLDECECGDYRRSHVDDAGLCRLCQWNPAMPGDPCMKFWLAKRHEREN